MNNDFYSHLKTRDTFFVILNLMVFRIFLHFPSIFFKSYSGGSLLSAMLSGLISLGFLSFIFWLWKKSPKGNLIRLSSKAFGRFGKLTATIISAVYVFLSAVSTLNDISSLSKIISFPSSPFWFVLLFFVLGALAGVFSGIDSVTRMHGIFVPLIGFGLSLLIISVISGGDFTRFFPIFKSGPLAIFSKSLRGTVMYFDILLLFLLPFPLKKDSFPLKNYLLAASLGIIINILFIFSVLASVSSFAIENTDYPFYLCLKEVYFGRFFQRLDALMQLLSAISGMLYLSLNGLIFSYLFGKSKSSVNQKIISLSYILIVFAAVLVLRAIGDEVFNRLLFIFGFSGVILLLITLLFSKRRKLNEKV